MAEPQALGHFQTASSGYLPFASLVSLNAIGTAGGVLRASIGYGGYIRRWHQAVYVDTVNNGSNYWTIQLLCSIPSSTLLTLTTAAASANTWTLLASINQAVAINRSMVSLLVYVSKVGSPGELYLGGPAVYVE